MQSPNRVMAYVHDAPGHESIRTRWRDPTLLAARGFTDVVVADQMSGCLGLAMADVDLSEIRGRIEAARAEGLSAWVMDDLLTLPAGFDGDVIAKTVELVEALFNALPEVTGLVVRLGETFESPRPWVERRDVFAYDLPGILRALLEAVCIRRGKSLLIRLWTLGEEGLHTSPEAWAGLRAGLGTWPEGAMVSVKHTRTDYWMYNDWNPHIATLDVPFLIEFQAEREYEGIGLMPAYPAAELLAGMAEMDNPMWQGYYLIPKGGGWSEPHSADDRWPEANVEAVLAGRVDEALCEIPALTRAVFYSEAWFDKHQRQWMPLENWFRDDTFVPGACAGIANALAADVALREAFMAERAEAAAAVPEAYAFMRDFAVFAEAMWAALIDAAPLTRAQAKAIIRGRLEATPLGPLRVLD